MHPFVVVGISSICFCALLAMLSNVKMQAVKQKVVDSTRSKAISGSVTSFVYILPMTNCHILLQNTVESGWLGQLGEAEKTGESLCSNYTILSN